MMDSDQVLTVREVSHYLKLGRSTIYRLAQGGRLPGRKVGGAWRFSRRGLDEWLAQQSPPASTHGRDEASAADAPPADSNLSPA